MTTALAAQGFELMIYGMGTVVVFLGLLVYAMRIMSWAVRRWFPDPVLAPVTTIRRPEPDRAEDATLEDVDPEILAVIAAAVHAHRERRAADARVPT